VDREERDRCGYSKESKIRHRELPG
jgi:hypothetical protein